MAEQVLEQQKEEIIKEMISAGLHYGHKRTTIHPRARYFIIKNYEEIATIDLAETLKAFSSALSFIKEIINKNGSILFAATSPSAKKAIRLLAEKHDFPYADERWLGGTLTNFKTLINRIKYMKSLEEQKGTDGWEKYTKKEKINLEKELNQLQKKFAGLRNMVKLPDALFIVDTGLHDTAVFEARRLNVPIIGILDTDDDPTLIDYPIPANDSAKSSIEYILGLVEKEIQNAKTTKLLEEAEIDSGEPDES